MKEEGARAGSKAKGRRQKEGGRREKGGRRKVGAGGRREEGYVALT